MHLDAVVVARPKLHPALLYFDPLVGLIHRELFAFGFRQNLGKTMSTYSYWFLMLYIYYKNVFAIKVCYM